MKKIDTFNAQEIANTVWALGKLELNEKDLPSDFNRTVCKAAMKKIDSFNAQDIANVAVSIIWLDVFDNFPFDFWNMLVLAAEKEQNSFNIQDWCNMMWCVAVDIGLYARGGPRGLHRRQTRTSRAGLPFRLLSLSHSSSPFPL